jgi:hypothetical protein
LKYKWIMLENKGCPNRLNQQNSIYVALSDAPWIWHYKKVKVIRYNKCILRIMKK